MTLTTEMIRAGQDAAPQLSAVEISAVWRAMCAAAPVAAQAQPDARTVDEIVSGLYRKFKEWSKRGFGPDDVTWCEVRAAVMELMNVQGQQPVSGADGLPLELRGVSEAVAEGDGFWRSCSGCHELNEGHDTGPQSKVFKCALGNGCSECGGIGAVWDTTDYGAMGDALAASMAQPQPSGNAGNSPANIIDALKFYADRNHFIIADDGAWDTVSGEPQNLWCDEAGTATVEDGSIARAALAARASANICNADKRQIPASQLQARGLDKDNIDAARAAEKEH